MDTAFIEPPVPCLDKIIGSLFTSETAKFFWGHGTQPIARPVCVKEGDCPPYLVRFT